MNTFNKWRRGLPMKTVTLKRIQFRQGIETFVLKEAFVYQ